MNDPQVTKEWLSEKLAVCDDSAVGAREPRTVDWKAAYEGEAAKFQQETRRTSDLSALLRAFADHHRVEHTSGAWSRGCTLCALVGKSDELLARPINAPTSAGVAAGYDGVTTHPELGLGAAARRIEWTPEEVRQGYAMRNGGKVYCCYGSYCEAGHSNDCPHAAGVRESGK